MAPKNRAFVPDPLEVEEAEQVAAEAKSKSKSMAALPVAKAKLVPVAKAEPEPKTSKGKPKVAPKGKAAKAKGNGGPGRTAGVLPMSKFIMAHFSKGSTVDVCVSAITKEYGACRRQHVVNVLRDQVAKYGWTRTDKGDTIKVSPPKSK